MSRKLVCALCKNPIPADDKISMGNAGAYCMACWTGRPFDCMSVDQAATRAGEERVARLDAEAGRFTCIDQVSAAYWQAHLGPKCLTHVERALAAQGDHADRDLIQLQHELAEAIRPNIHAEIQRTS